jgi:ribosome-associated toxin RatA of RatAB toxin-antitoxin module
MYCFKSREEAFTSDFRNEEAYARCKLEIGMGNFKPLRRTWSLENWFYCEVEYHINCWYSTEIVSINLSSLFTYYGVFKSAYPPT